MAEFSELVKSIKRVRAYIRGFYIFGWRTRSEYVEKSPRSYDNERRRIESWLGSYVRRNRSDGGRNVCISMNINDEPRNPLYEIWRTKSFTKNDVLLHFFLLDMTAGGASFTAEQATDEILERYGEFFDVSTVRKKMKEYEAAGLLRSEKTGKKLSYGQSDVRFEELPEALLEAVDFYTEMAPFGEVGSFIQDLCGRTNRIFRFKHHFVVHTLEDEILLSLLEAIANERRVRVKIAGARAVVTQSGVPVSILVSIQSGRRYVALYENDDFAPQRLDKIEDVEIGERTPEFEWIRSKFEDERRFSWGVTYSASKKLEKVSMILRIDEKNEGYVLDRLKREGRQGRVERIGDNTFRYSVAVWDSSELLPFAKSFTGRLLSFRSSNRMVKKLFYKDMERMFAMYGDGEGEQGHD